MTHDEARALIAEGRAHDEAFDNPTSTAEYGSASTWIRVNLARLLDMAELGVMSHERDHQPFGPGQRDLVIEVCHDLINRAMRDESDPVPSTEYAAGHRAKEAAIRAMLDGYAEALEERERLRAALTAWRADIEAACTDEGWQYTDSIDEILKGEP